MTAKAARTDWAVFTPITSRWIFPAQTVPEAVSALAADLNVPLVAAQLLYRRGYRDAESAWRFLNPALSDLLDPFLLRDMDRAVDRIACAIARRERIEIHGDYDVDGVTSTVILKKALEIAGGDVGWHIPHRLNDGYGMQPTAIEEAASRGARLIISVDNGIRATAAIEKARELGVDVIVTDHHLPEAELPPALALVNPNRIDCGYANKNLCGAGVAFKLAHAVLLRGGCAEARLARILESLLKLVAIATIADIVPLTGENRVIARHGLNGLRDPRNPGLRALLEAAGIRNRVPNTGEVGFRVAPAINASGRMDSAGAAVRMFLTEDPEEAASIARELFTLNQQRQIAERKIVDEIFQLCEQTAVTDHEAALVFWGEGWHRGVVGIVASRVVEKFNRPAIVLGVENGLAQGSGRSIEAFHLLEALESMREEFTKFGGHAHAAGLTLPEENLERFRERFRAHAATLLTPEDFCPLVEIDAALEAREIDDALWRALERIGPFGPGNERPLFAFRRADLAGAPQPWKEKHARIAVRHGGRSLLLKAFGMGARCEELLGCGQVDIAFEIERDFEGRWDLIARDWRASAVVADDKMS
jgi:single-stranded-DNA-specific exonuclease